jgi:hypothetical protein
LNLNNANLFELDLNISKVQLVPPLLNSPPSHQQDRPNKVILLLLSHASHRLIFLLKIPPSTSKKDRHKQGAHNLPPETHAEATTSAKGSTTSGGGDFREREGRGGKPPDLSVISDSLQAVKNDVRQEAEEKFDPTDDGCELMTEDLTDEQLGNPVDPGPGEG